MIKFTNTCSRSLTDGSNSTVIEYTTHAVTISEVIDDFKYFLLGSGYSPKLVNDYLCLEEEEE